jgi:predicted SAM-dependent methyltransferase
MINKIFKKLIYLAGAFLSGILWFLRDYFKYNMLLKNGLQKSPLYLFPKIFDKSPYSHTFDKHYVYMDRWAFQHVQKSLPKEHVDVGSSIRFLSMATTVTKLKFVDIRPVQTDFENYECVEGSILALPFADNSVLSLSCLHVAEHIGLGRYGDPLDVQGTQKACKELERVLASGGTLYFALPIGKERTYFNAHRVHSPQTILNYFKNLKLEEFSAVTDMGQYVKNVDWHDFLDSSYSCGLFKFSKNSLLLNP